MLVELDPAQVVAVAVQQGEHGVRVALADRGREVEDAGPLVLSVHGAQRPHARRDVAGRTGDDVAEHRSGLDAGELVGVTDEHDRGVGADRGEQMRHERQRDHRHLVDDDDVVGERPARTVAEPGAVRAAEEAVERDRLELVELGDHRLVEVCGEGPHGAADRLGHAGCGLAGRSGQCDPQRLRRGPASALGTGIVLGGDEAGEEAGDGAGLARSGATGDDHQVVVDPGGRCGELIGVDRGAVGADELFDPRCGAGQRPGGATGSRGPVPQVRSDVALERPEPGQVEPFVLDHEGHEVPVRVPGHRAVVAPVHAGDERRLGDGVEPPVGVGPVELVEQRRSSVVVLGRRRVRPGVGVVRGLGRRCRLRCRRPRRRRPPRGRTRPWCGPRPGRRRRGRAAGRGPRGLRRAAPAGGASSAWRAKAATVCTSVAPNTPARTNGSRQATSAGTRSSALTPVPSRRTGRSTRAPARSAGPR